MENKTTQSSALTNSPTWKTPIPEGEDAEIILRKILPFLRHLTMHEAPILPDREAKFMLGVLNGTYMNYGNGAQLASILAHQVRDAVDLASFEGVDRLRLSDWLESLSNNEAFLLYAGAGLFWCAVRCGVTDAPASDFLRISENSDFPARPQQRSR